MNSILLKLFSFGPVIIVALILSASQSHGSSCAPSPAGIVAWWKGDGNTEDAAAGNNGVNQNVTYANGVVDQAFAFDPENYSYGTYTGIQIADQPAYALTNSLSIEGWVRPRGDGYIIFWRGDNRPGLDPYTISMQGDNTVLFQICDANGNGAEVGTTLNYNQWTHLAATLDDSTGTMSLYTNGVLAAQTITTIRPYGPLEPGDSPGIGIGNLNDGENNFPFIGDIDEISLYDRALSQTEIQSIYNAGSAGKCALTPASGPPVISNLSPAIGTNGAVIDILGTNFSSTAAADIVYFGAVQANVLAATSNSLVVTVPVGATFGPITVTVGGLTAYSGQMFEPTFIGTNANITTSGFAPSFDLNNAEGPGSCVIADLDGDGKPDIAYVSSAGAAVSILKNISPNGAPLGAASFAPPVELPFPTNGTAGNAYRLRAVDLDGDGKLDLVACEVYGNRVSVFHNLSSPGTLTTNSFAPAFALIAGNDCRFAAAADLDRDGRVDIVALNYGDKTISIFKNIGTAGSLTAASFAPPVVLSAPGGPYEVAIADMDGDGRPDLAVANSDSGTISIFQNLSAPGVLNTNSFAPSFDLPCGNTAATIVAVDIDGDGRLDLVAGAVQSETISVYRNVSTGGLLTTNSFAPKVDFSTGDWTHTLAIADFNGDGKPDIAVVGELPSTLSIFENISTPGSFTSASLASRVDFATGWNAWGVAAGDLDGDGRPDIVFCNYYDSTIQIYQNLMPFGAPAAPLPPVITSINPNTGAPGTTVTISGNNFSPFATSDTVYFGAVKANVLSASTSSLTVIVPTGATYAPVTVTVNGLIAYADAPFNITFAGAAGGSPVLGPRLDLPMPLNPGTTFFADMDGDGKPDLVVGSASGFSIYQNISTNGTVSAASFAPRLDIPLPPGLSAMAVADVDGDGKLDVVAVNGVSNQVLVVKNFSTPGILTTNSFAAPVAFATGSGPRCVAVQDLDGDGRPELIVGNYNDSTVSVFHNTGSGGISSNSFSPAVTFALGANPQSVAVADLDGDGLPDIVTANNYSGTTASVSILRNTSTTGNISFAPNVDLAGLPTSFCVVVGDLDGDGKLDLVVSSFNEGQAVSVYRNLSTPGSLSASTFEPHVDFSAGGWGNAVAIGDLDGDGKPDLAVVTQLPDHFSIFKNISSPGSFTTNSLAARADYPTGWNPIGVAIGDIDGDGRPDIALGVDYASTLSIFQNLTPFAGPAVAPTITQQPTNETVTVAATAELNVLATGTSPLTYQWSFDGNNLAGATNAILILTNVSTALAGDYFVTVSNLVGSVVCSNVVLTVLVPPSAPVIVAQSPDQTVLLGSAATFSVAVNGSIPLAYSWSQNGTPIPNATNSSYTLADVQLSNSGSEFSCVVTNIYGSATSSNILLKVIDSTIPNDLCSGAIVITNSSYTNYQSTVAATSYGDPVPDCVDGFGHGVWYQFTAPAAGLLIVDTFGSDFDTGLGVYTGSCDSLTEVGCNDDFGGITSQVTMPTAAGTTYFIIAGGYESDAGGLVLHLNHLTPPAFVLEPTNISVIVSSNAVFSTTLSGTLPINLQWYFNNTPLMDGGRTSGSTNATLKISGVMTNDAGNYFVVASNVLGVVTSSVAVLTPIILPPVFLQAPLSQSVLVGSNANFFAVVGGTSPFNYQWYFNGNALADDGVHIAGSMTASLTISNLTTADAGTYSLTVTNVSGSTNGEATLTVLVPPGITLNPIGRSVPPGLPTVFTGAANGIPAPTYQWQLNGTNLPGATSASYTNAAIGINDLGYYQLVASNSAGIAFSSTAQLTFGPVAAWGLNDSSESLPPPGLSNVVQIVGGFGSAFALRSDGMVVPWGTAAGLVGSIPSTLSNVVELAISGNPEGGDYALRSDGTVVGWTNFAPPPLSNIVQVAAGYSFGLALRAEGTVVGWGALPNGTVPTGLSHLIAIACGDTHSLALRSDGTVSAWGTGPATNVPVGLANVAAIAAGYTHSLALQSNGTVVAWGSGTGTNLPAGLSNVVAIATENSASTETLSLALRADGTVVAWGDNSYGESTPPAALSNLLTVAVSPGYDHGLALVNSGSPQFLQMPVGLTAYVGRKVTLRASVVGASPLSYQWLLDGANVPGATNTSLVISNLQFADAGNYELFVSNSINTAISLPAPLTVVSNSTLTFLSQNTGVTNYQGSIISLFAPGVLGNGPLNYQWFYSTTNQNFAAVSGATNDTLILNPALAGQSGNYYLAVSNQIGGVTSTPFYVRVMFSKAWGYTATDAPFVLTNATAIAVDNYGLGNSAGAYYALSSAGKISGWSGTQITYSETNFNALNNSIVTAIAAGFGDALALKSDGTLYAIGDNAYGETNIPAAATAGDIVAIACGDYHDLALNYFGTVIGWGQNTFQQTTNAAATNLVAVAAGGNNSIGLRADGSVLTWGQFGKGQFLVPPTATNIIAVAAGESHFLALRANGTVVGWGENTYGQISIPSNWTNIVAILAAGNHSTVLRKDGTVAGAGAYYPYQAGIAASLPSLTNVVAIAGSGDRDLALFGTRAPVITIQPWDRSIPAGVSTNITLAAKCSGSQPVNYQWQLNGINIVGATNDTLSLGQGSLGKPAVIPPGAYQLIASNAYGVTASAYAKITTFIPLGVALNATNLSWITSGDAQWYGETNVTHDGVSAAQSGDLGLLQQTLLQTTVATNYSGRYTFWWKVSSEPYFDILEFRINGIVQTSISGEVDWEQVSIPVPAGTNVLLWRYYKEDDGDEGQDAGWVDQFSFVPDPPLINVQPLPASQTVNWGTTVVLAVSASGAPPMEYVWTQNGIPIGGNSPSLILDSVGRAQGGTYCVTVSNTGGTTVSSNAVLNVRVPQILGAPQILPNGTFEFTSTDINGGLLSQSDLANFEAQASTDLVNWVILPDALSLTNGMLLLQDNSTNFNARYYRIVEY